MIATLSAGMHAFLPREELADQLVDDATLSRRGPVAQARKPMTARMLACISALGETVFEPRGSRADRAAPRGAAAFAVLELADRNGWRVAPGLVRRRRQVGEG